MATSHHGPSTKFAVPGIRRPRILSSLLINWGAAEEKSYPFTHELTILILPTIQECLSDVWSVYSPILCITFI